MVCWCANRVTKSWPPCKFRPSDILSPLLPLFNLCSISSSRTFISLPYSSFINLLGCFTVISNPRGISLLNYPSIHPSVSHSACIFAQLHLHLSCSSPINCFSTTLHRCAFCHHPGESYILPPSSSCPIFPFFPLRFSLSGGAQVHTAGLY